MIVNSRKPRNDSWNCAQLVCFENKFNLSKKCKNLTIISNKFKEHFIPRFSVTHERNVFNIKIFKCKLFNFELTNFTRLTILSEILYTNGITALF